MAAACVGGVAVVAVAGFVLLPRLLGRATIPGATFNAPMMVIRAASTGQVASVSVAAGQSVEPATVLMTIHVQPPPDPAAAQMRDRLEAARVRLAALEDALAQPAANSDTGRSRVADLRRQRAAAAADMAQLQDSVATLPAQPPGDVPIRADIHGVVRSLEIRPGAPTAAGAPLVRMLDCDRAFLTMAPGSTLKAGDRVEVRLPKMAAVAAVVRRSSGISEPDDALVIAPVRGAFSAILGGACPIGAMATVTLLAREPKA